MPIELPNLDDRRFDELVEDGKRLIPGYAPSWTDHNPSDPGITFIELFAFIAEMFMYRVDRISEDNKRAFAKLLLGQSPEIGKPVDAEILRAIQQLRDEERAVTSEDYERLAMELPEKLPNVKIDRVHCLPQRNLESGESDAAGMVAVSHVSIIVLPDPDKVMQQKVKEYLQERSLLATRLHVVPAKYLKIGVRLVVHIYSDRKEAEMKSVIHETLSKYFDSLTGGGNGTGWSFGQPVYISDLYALLDNVEGVDYIERVDDDNEVFVLDQNDTQARDIINAQGFLGLQLKANELIEFLAEESNIRFDRVENEQFN